MERFPNILRIYHGNAPRIFHEHIFAWWFPLIHVYANNIVFILKIRRCSYKITIIYLLLSIFLGYLFVHIRPFFCFFIFLLYNDVYFEYTQRYRKMTIKELRDFIYENYCRQTGFTKENSYYSMI